MLQNRDSQHSSFEGSSSVTQSSVGSRMNKVWRQKRRHSGLFQAVLRLDTEMDAAARRELADWITEQYHTEFDAVPLGFVAQCHLGAPYIDHRLDLIGSIVEHYSPSQQMPVPFESARMMARTSSYVFVEVFATGELVAVLADGSTA